MKGFCHLAMKKTKFLAQIQNKKKISSGSILTGWSGYPKKQIFENRPNYSDTCVAYLDEVSKLDKKTISVTDLIVYFPITTK